MLDTYEGINEPYTESRVFCYGLTYDEEVEFYADEIMKEIDCGTAHMLDCVAKIPHRGEFAIVIENFSPEDTIFFAAVARAVFMKCERSGGRIPSITVEVSKICPELSRTIYAR